jgi:hypothetical protein
MLSRQERNGTLQRINVQENIINRWGMQLIQEKRQALCRLCVNSPCALLPITLAGTDCPYFRDDFQP